MASIALPPVSGASVSSNIVAFSEQPGDIVVSLLRLLRTARRAGATQELRLPDVRITVEPVQPVTTPTGTADVDLTHREREVASLAAGGYRNREIAQHLGITENTVKRHLYSVYNKVGVDTRTQLANRLGVTHP